MTEYHRVELPVKAAANVPTPAAGKVALFADSDNANRVSQKDSVGAVIDLAATGAGGGAQPIIIQTSVDVPGGTVGYYEWAVVNIDVLPNALVMPWLVGEIDADNDLEGLQDDAMQVFGVPETGQIRFAIVGNGAFNGLYKVNYIFYLGG